LIVSNRISIGSLHHAKGKYRMTIGIPAYEQLIDILRDEIISGDIPADSRLTIIEIAKRFSVSQMPVREALQRLQGEGLIKGIPHKGARVISIDEQFVRNIYEVRGVMEGLLACGSLSGISTAMIRALKDINRKISEVTGDEKTEEILTLDREFHIKIYEHSDNYVAFDIHNNFTSLLSKLRSKYGFGPFRLNDLIRQHEDIIAALRAKDRTDIERVVRKHRVGSMKDLLEQMPVWQHRKKGGGRV
jgi:DNA-binding GntR family transcriptional regulator